MRMPLRIGIASLVAMATPARPGAAKIWHVRVDGSGDAPTIQAGIDAASAGDSVVLAAGTYTWTAQGGDRVGLPGPSMINMRSGVTLKGTSGPEVTILDAEGHGRVIRCQSTSNVRIEGLTLQAGDADAAGLPGPFSEGTGGAILCKYGSSIVIANSFLRNNRSKYNGGALALSQSSSEILGNVICWNTGQYGVGGIYASGGSAQVRGNTVASNAGGGVGFYQATGTFTENLLLDTLGGGGLWCGDADVIVTCNNMWGNPNGNATTCSVGSGNITQDPLVCITSSEFHVQPGSPCLPENNSCGVLMGARGVGCTTTDVQGRLPRAGVWLTASPNPFNPQTRIAYALHPIPEHVELTIYDLSGRRIARLVDEQASGLSSSVVWNGNDETKVSVGTGVYVARLVVGSDVTTAKLVLVK